MNNTVFDNADIHSQVMEGWKRALVSLFFLVFILFIAYGETFLSMIVTWWRSETYAHGFLILPISIYLIWKGRHRLYRQNQRTELTALAPLVGMVFLWLIAHIANILVVQQLAVVSMLILSVLLVFGRYAAFSILFPLLYLYFLVPFGEFLIPKLQDVTAYIAVRGLQLTGIPVFWEGLFFTIPSGSFEVAEACSGIRYLIASLALGTVYAYLVYSSSVKRAIFIALSIIVPIIANGLRAYGIVLLADLSDYKLATGVDHLIYGWIFFGLVMGLLFWLGSKFKDAEHPLDGLPPYSLLGAGASVTANRSVSVRQYGFAVLSASLIIAAGPAATSHLERNSHEYQVNITLPEELIGLAKTAPDGVFEWAPHYAGADNYVGAIYRGKRSSIELYVAYYTHQEQGEELVKINNRYLASGWARIDERINVYQAMGGGEYSFRVLHATRGGRKVILFQEYYIDGKYTPNAVKAKLHEIISSLTGRNRISAIVMFSINEDSLGDSPDGVIEEVISILHRDLVFTVGTN